MIVDPSPDSSTLLDAALETYVPAASIMVFTEALQIPADVLAQERLEAAYVCRRTGTCAFSLRTVADLCEALMEKRACLA